MFGFLGNPQATLEALTHTAATLGVEISPQALEQRFTASAAACLPQVLLTASTRVITYECSAPGEGARDSQALHIAPVGGKG